MAVNIAQIEQQVREMSTEDAPGRELCSAIAELARTGRFLQLRGVLPGLSYQMGVLFSSSVGYIEAVLGEHFSYATSMGGLAAVVLLIGAVVIWAGPEAKGISFLKTVKEPVQT